MSDERSEGGSGPPRLLIFGGTFDPPHLAHTTLPPLAARQLGCERILYIPTAVNPLKTGQPATPAEHRLAMLRLALAEVPNAEISTIELDRPGPSYTAETLQALREQCRNAELRLLIGSDQALTFHRWKDWRRILELATPAVMLRPPLDEAAYRRRLLETHSPQETERWLSWTIHVPQVNTGGTETRRRLAAGEDTGNLLAPAVADYARQHELYRM